MIFNECSAKTSDGVNEGFIGLAKKLMAKKDANG